MKFLMLIMLLSLFLTLSGCKSNGGLGSPGSPLWGMTTNDTEKMEFYKQKCRDYGYTSGSEFYKCVYDTERYYMDKLNANTDRFRDAVKGMKPKMPEQKTTTCRRVNGSLVCNTM